MENKNVYDMYEIYWGDNRLQQTPKIQSYTNRCIINLRNLYEPYRAEKSLLSVIRAYIPPYVVPIPPWLEIDTNTLLGNTIPYSTVHSFLISHIFRHLRINVPSVSYDKRDDLVLEKEVIFSNKVSDSSNNNNDLQINEKENETTKEDSNTNVHESPLLQHTKKILKIPQGINNILFQRHMMVPLYQDDSFIHNINTNRKRRRQETPTTNNNNSECTLPIARSAFNHFCIFVCDYAIAQLLSCGIFQGCTVDKKIKRAFSSWKKQEDNILHYIVVDTSIITLDSTLCSSNAINCCHTILSNTSNICSRCCSIIYCRMGCKVHTYKKNKDKKIQYKPKQLKSYERKKQYQEIGTITSSIYDQIKHVVNKAHCTTSNCFSSHEISILLGNDIPLRTLPHFVALHFAEYIGSNSAVDNTNNSNSTFIDNTKSNNSTTVNTNNNNDNTTLNTDINIIETKLQDDESLYDIENTVFFPPALKNIKSNNDNIIDENNTLSKETVQGFLLSLWRNLPFELKDIFFEREKHDSIAFTKILFKQFHIPYTEYYAAASYINGNIVCLPRTPLQWYLHLKEISEPKNVWRIYYNQYTNKSYQYKMLCDILNGKILLGNWMSIPQYRFCEYISNSINKEYNNRILDKLNKKNVLYKSGGPSEFPFILSSICEKLTYWESNEQLFHSSSIDAHFPNIHEITVGQQLLTPIRQLTWLHTTVRKELQYIKNEYNLNPKSSMNAFNIFLYDISKSTNNINITNLAIDAATEWNKQLKYHQRLRYHVLADLDMFRYWEDVRQLVICSRLWRIFQQDRCISKNLSNDIYLQQKLYNSFKKLYDSDGTIAEWDILQLENWWSSSTSSSSSSSTNEIKTQPRLVNSTTNWQTIIQDISLPLVVPYQIDPISIAKNALYQYAMNSVIHNTVEHTTTYSDKNPFCIYSCPDTYNLINFQKQSLYTIKSLYDRWMPSILSDTPLKNGINTATTAGNGTANVDNTTNVDGITSADSTTNVDGATTIDSTSELPQQIDDTIIDSLKTYINEPLQLQRIIKILLRHNLLKKDIFISITRNDIHTRLGIFQIDLVNSLLYAIEKCRRT